MTTRSPLVMIPDEERCCVDVGFRGRCSSRGVVERGGYRYCKRHDPEAVKARRAASDARRDAKNEARYAAWNREQRISAARDAVIAAARAWAADMPGTTLADAVRALDDAERP